MSDEKSSDTTTNVLTITRPSPASRKTSSAGVEVLSTIEDIDSTHTLTPTATSFDEKAREAHAFSPFYNPAPTRLSLEAHKSESKLNVNVISTNYDTDLEACLTPQKSAVSGSKAGLLNSKRRANEECTVWPGQKMMKLKKKEMRRAKAKYVLCPCMAGLGRNTRIWIKVIIALVIIGGAIGVGVGVSKAVGGGVWKNNNNANAPIAGQSNSGS